MNMGERLGVVQKEGEVRFIVQVLGLVRES